MNDDSRKIAAQQREMPEPYEGNRPVPWLVILIVAGLFIWAISYLYLSYQPAPAQYGDQRVAADFHTASGGAGGKVDGGQLNAWPVTRPQVRGCRAYFRPWQVPNGSRANPRPWPRLFCMASQVS
jgi:hypothetical protein